MKNMHRDRHWMIRAVEGKLRAHSHTVQLSMIERFQVIAIFLSRFKPLILLFGALSLLAFLFSLFEASWLNGDRLLIPSILGFCWSVTLFSIVEIFGSIPARPGAKAGLRVRMSVGIKRSAFWLLAVLMLGLSTALLVLSYQLLRTWLMA